jgi:hypothetical protein
MRRLDLRHAICDSEARAAPALKMRAVTPILWPTKICVIS